MSRERATTRADREEDEDVVVDVAEEEAPSFVVLLSASREALATSLRQMRMRSCLAAEMCGIVCSVASIAFVVVRISLCVCVFLGDEQT